VNLESIQSVILKVSVRSVSHSQVLLDGYFLLVLVISQMLWVNPGRWLSHCSLTPLTVGWGGNWKSKSEKTHGL